MNTAIKILFCVFTFHILLISAFAKVSQTSLLRPYRGYADVTTFHYFLPSDLSNIEFLFSALTDSDICPKRDVHIYLQPASYPVMLPDNATFPDKVFLNRTSLHSLVLPTLYKPHNLTVFSVENPLPGSWFAVAYLPDWDHHVQQEGVSHKCQYALASIAIWSDTPDIPAIPIDTRTRIRISEPFSYLKFLIPAGIWEFTIKIDSFTCDTITYHQPLNLDHKIVGHYQGAGHPCVHPPDVYLKANALPGFDTGDIRFTVSKGARESLNLVYTERLPFTESPYYLLIVSDLMMTLNITIIVNVRCPTQAFESKPAKYLRKTSEVKNSSCECSPIFRMARMSQQGDYSEKFLFKEQDKEFTTSLPVTDLTPVGVAFEILPYIDIGGTLIAKIVLDLGTIQQEGSPRINLHVYGCLRLGRPPEAFCCNSSLPSSCCQPDLSVQVSSESKNENKDFILVPFPEPGTWFMSFITVCYAGKHVIPCATEDALISVEIQTQPCFSTPESENPCGEYGTCEKTIRGQFSFASCRCSGGYRGWACNDDSQATSKARLIASLVILVTSNLFFLPAIVLGIYRKLFIHVVIYSATMISSMFYHACDQQVYFYCIVNFYLLQFTDFFCSILAIWITTISLANIEPKYEICLYLLGAIGISIGVGHNPTGFRVFIIPFAIGITILVSAWVYRSIKRREIIRPSRNTLIQFLPGILLGAIGLCIYAFIQTEENYMFAHSAWHAIIALSVMFMLPSSQKNGEPITPEVNEAATLSGISVSVDAGDSQQEPEAPSPSREISMLYFHSQLHDIYSEKKS